MEIFIYDSNECKMLRTMSELVMKLPVYFNYHFQLSILFVKFWPKRKAKRLWIIINKIVFNHYLDNLIR